jgi:hypothetical protein
MRRLERWMHRHERWMYGGTRPNRMATALNWAWARIGAAGLWRQRLVTLEVRGRRSGRKLSLPLVVTHYGGAEFLVPMLGERAGWIANVRAAGGRVSLLHGDREDVTLEEVPVELRAPILRRYLELAPAARSFLPVDRAASQAEFQRIAADYPVFRIRRDGVPHPSTSI